jgi:hypothetical protein
MLDQMDRAERRGIAFEMSPDEWWSWWQRDGRWQQRGVGRDRLCMARVGDAGPYAIGNVYCATNAENMQDAWDNGRCGGGGRPRKLSDQDVEYAKALLAEEEIPVAEVAKLFGVCRDTLYSYLPGGRSAIK